MNCANCKKDVEKSNYCPHCGFPLNDEAKKLEDMKITNARLETLLKISELTSDEKTLLSIKNLVAKLKKED